VRYEQQDVDQESKQRHKQRRKREDQQGEEVSRRVGRRVEVRGDREREAYQRHESGNGMDDKDRGERVSGRRGQRELGGGRISEEAICALSVYKLVRRRLRGSNPGVVHTSVVADHRPIACAISAVPENAKVHPVHGGDGYPADNGRGERGQQQQHEGHEE